MPFSRSVLLSSEGLQCAPWSKGIRAVSVSHQNLLWVYYCWLMQMFFTKEFDSFLKGKQSQSCCVLCSLCVASQFHSTGLPLYPIAEPHPLFSPCVVMKCCFILALATPARKWSCRAGWSREAVDLFQELAILGAQVEVILPEIWHTQALLLPYGPSAH